MVKLTIRPVGPDRWDDLATLFGPSGAYSGCWCMYLRESSREFDAGCRDGGKANRARFRKVVRSGSEPGLLAYEGKRPVGWVAVAPRFEYGRVLRSPVHKPVDDAEGVWAITCFFVHRHARGRGVATALLEAAVAFARRKGARIVEAYPVTTDEQRPDAALWRGTEEMFAAAGFEPVARRKPSRPIMRRRA